MTVNRVNITVGMKGTVSASAPFNTVINPRHIQECVSVESIRGMLSQGVEVFDEIYAPVNLDESTFDQHVDDDVRIITFQSSSGDVYRIPEVYVNGLPYANGVPYRCIMLGISLSIVPDGMDLSSIKSEVAELVFDQLGVRSEVKEVVFGEPLMLTSSQHDAIETARVANIVNNPGSLLRIRQLQEIVDRQAQTIQVLENYIKINMSPV